MLYAGLEKAYVAVLDFSYCTKKPMNSPRKRRLRKTLTLNGVTVVCLIDEDSFDIMPTVFDCLLLRCGGGLGGCLATILPRM